MRFGMFDWYNVYLSTQKKHLLNGPSLSTTILKGSITFLFVQDLLDKQKDAHNLYLIKYFRAWKTEKKYISKKWTWNTFLFCY